MECNKLTRKEPGSSRVVRLEMAWRRYFFLAGGVGFFWQWALRF
jgi:hypothetical protein